MQNDATALPAPIACPYCGRPLRWTSDHWREALECESCGKFSHFGGATSAPREHDAPHATPPITEKKDDAGEESGG